VKIETLTVDAYGPFTGLTLRLGDAPGRVHIVHGLNEAGKTSLLRAITALLFRIERQCTDNFLHSNQDLRITATIADAQGATRVLSRLKRNDPSLRDERDNPIEEAVLAAMLGGVDREVFEHFFGLTHESLRDGGKAMVAGEGDLGRSLFESGGLNGLNDLLANYKKEGERLFLRRGQRELNARLSQIEAARTRAKTALLRSSDWLELKKNQQRLADEYAEAQRAWAQESREWERLKRVHGNKPEIAERERLAEELVLLGDVPELCADFEERRVRVEAALRNAQTRIAQLETRLRDRSDAHARMAPENPLLQHATTVRDLQRRIEQYRSLTTDRQKRQRASEDARAAAGALWQQLFPGRGVEGITQFRVSAAQETALRALNDERLRLETIAEAARENASSASEQLAVAQQQMKELPVAVDVAVLTTTIEAIRGQGRLEDRVSEAQKAVATAQYKVQQAQHALPCWTDSAQNLSALKVPSTATLQRFERAHGRLLERASELEQRRTHIQQRLGGLRKELDKLVRDSAVPSEDELHAEREIRNQGWALIRQYAFEHALTLEEATERYEPPAVLAVAFEQHLQHADQIADQLRTDSDRVSTHVQLTRQMEEEEQGLTSVRDAQVQLEAERQCFDSDWAGQWPELGFAPMTPQEMQAWCLKREAALTALATQREQEQEFQQALASLNIARGALSEALQNHGTVLGEKESLAAALLRAQRIVDSAVQVEQRRSELQGAIRQHERSLQKAAAKLAEVEGLTQNWQARWRQATVGLSLDNPQPALVMVLLGKTREVLQLWDEHRRMADRVSAIDADVRRFEADVKRVLDDIAPDLAATACDAAVEALSDRVESARAAQSTRMRLASEIEELEGELSQERVLEDKANEQFAGLRELASCGRNEELAAIGERYGRKRQLTDSLQLIDKGLVARNGKTVTEIIREAAEQDSDALPGNVADAERRVTEMDDKRAQLLQGKVNAERDLEERERADDHAAIVQELQEHVTVARDLVDRYVRTRLAVAILERSMEEYRNRYQGQVLQRASELFARLTLGRYKGLSVENEADRTVMWALRENRGNKRVAISALSDGSADQLFLALRLASIEQRVRDGQAVPCVFDDILVNFDDQRAVAALNVLAEMSGQNQILLFTHHDHLIRLAEQAIPNAVAVHYLQSEQSQVAGAH
jgi:uncharacterized protein YhaN